MLMLMLVLFIVIFTGLISLYIFCALLVYFKKKSKNRTGDEDHTDYVSFGRMKIYFRKRSDDERRRDGDDLGDVDSDFD